MDRMNSLAIRVICLLAVNHFYVSHDININLSVYIRIFKAICICVIAVAGFVHDVATAANIAGLGVGFVHNEMLKIARLLKMIVGKYFFMFLN